MVGLWVVQWQRRQAAKRWVQRKVKVAFWVCNQIFSVYETWLLSFGFCLTPSQFPNGSKLKRVPVSIVALFNNNGMAIAQRGIGSGSFINQHTWWWNIAEAENKVDGLTLARKYARKRIRPICRSEGTLVIDLSHIGEFRSYDMLARLC